MARFKVDPRKVRGVVMKDGTQYEVGRNGTVNIDNPRHLREIRNSPGTKDWHEASLDATTLTVPMATGKYCPACSFSAWGWQTECPRCGADMP